MNTSLIIGGLALALVIACIGVAIAALYYSIQPRGINSTTNFSSLTGNAVTSTGNISAQNLTATQDISANSIVGSSLNLTGNANAVAITKGTIATSGIINVTGTTNATSPSTGSMTTLGGIGVNGNFYTSGSVYLPTTGATSAPLNNYSEYVLNTYVIGPFGASPISTQAIYFHFVRFGSAVTVEWLFPAVSVPVITQNEMTLQANFPAGFIPNQTVIVPVFVVNGVSNSTTSIGAMSILTTGNIVIYGNTNFGPFLSGNYAGIGTGSASWTII